MCFYHDYDWYADISETKTQTADKCFSCLECGGPIKKGEQYTYIYMQEHEECRECGYPKCVCNEHDFGEIYHYHRCEECTKFLQAIKQTELEAGCQADESQPSLQGLTEEVWHLDMHEKRKYFKRALRMFPELKQTGYLGRMWQAVRGA